MGSLRATSSLAGWGLRGTQRDGGAGSLGIFLPVQLVPWSGGGRQHACSSVLLSASDPHPWATSMALRLPITAGHGTVRSLAREDPSWFVHGGMRAKDSDLRVLCRCPALSPDVHLSCLLAWALGKSFLFLICKMGKYYLGSVGLSKMSLKLILPFSFFSLWQSKETQTSCTHKDKLPNIILQKKSSHDKWSVRLFI